MGVSAVGKSTVGTALAAAIGLPFEDGDDLHPQANIDKMAAGIPLSDVDRWPWLQLVGKSLARPGGAVIACSALKRAYRDCVRDDAPDAFFVFLHADARLLSARAAGRQGHFMPTTLLESQLAALEPLASDEHGVSIDVEHSVDTIVTGAIRALSGSHRR